MIYIFFLFGIKLPKLNLVNIMIKNARITIRYQFKNYGRGLIGLGTGRGHQDSRL